MLKHKSICIRNIPNPSNIDYHSMMKLINCDLGECLTPDPDDMIMPLVDMANIACGGHAGDHASMNKTILLAKKHHVKIGAHLSYLDKENFGRISQAISTDDLFDMLLNQISDFQSLCLHNNVEMTHIKPHGALYHDMMHTSEILNVLCRLINEVDPSLELVVQAGLNQDRLAEKSAQSSIKFIYEAFADRAYQGNQMIARTESGAMLTEPEQIVAQYHQFSQQQSVAIDTICFHSDHPASIAALKLLKSKQMFDIKLASENAIIIYFGDEVAPELAEKIAFYTQLLQQSLNELIIDVVPSYTSVMISYRIDKVDYDDFCQQVSTTLSKANFVKEQQQSVLIEIPAYYDPEVGLDLERILSERELSLDKFIDIHSNQTYLIYAIGFSPVFAFLGMVDKRIQMPRLKTPRVKIPAGSVGIADNQTAVYPIDSSGGWNIIARTPIDLSLNNNDNLNRFKIGNKVKFTAINRQQYLSLGGKFEFQSY